LEQAQSQYTERHQDIKDGWFAMDNKTRRAVLLEALSGVPKDYSSYWKAWLDHKEHTKDDPSHKSTQTPISQKHRTKFLSPSINQADLLKRDLLWIFIPARASNTADRFAQADFNEMTFGWEVGALTSYWLDEHVVALRYCHAEAGQTETNGQLYRDDEDPSFSGRGEKLLELYDFRPHQELLILEQQAIIYKFLSTCCEGITRWVDSNSRPYTSMDQYPPQLQHQKRKRKRAVNLIRISPIKHPNKKRTTSPYSPKRPSRFLLELSLSLDLLRQKVNTFYLCVDWYKYFNNIHS
jgi:hypothetical protein